MKLPVLWIVAAFATGILLAGPLPLMVPETPADPAGGLVGPINPQVWLALAVAAVLAALGLLRRRWNRAALFAALLCWAFLGGLAARLQQVARPAQHVTHRFANGQVTPGEALRWRGRLRDDPAGLPWGLRYDVELEEVDIAGQTLPVTGGLRITYFRNDRSPETLPPLRAGDRIEALVRTREPRNARNPGAFDARAFFDQQNIHLTATLRSTELLGKLAGPPPGFAHRLARVRGKLLERLDTLFAASRQNQGAVLRAMLLGDRSFISTDRAEAFQKSSAYHVLVIAGLHVAALATFVLWAGRKFRLPLLATTFLTLAALAAYAGIVEDRPPILRAALMGATFLCARLFYRRVELLNTTALAALLILAARPSALADSSFQFSFVAVGTIGALAVPWMSRSSEPYRRALRHLADTTRDGAFPPRLTQFRLDARAAAGWFARRLPALLASRASSCVTVPCGVALRLWEIALLSATIQLGMLPLLANSFHRVSLAGPLANIPAVLLTGLIVPMGFLTLVASLIWPGLGGAFAKVLGVLVSALTASVEWFAQLSWTSYRIPGPPAWLLAGFFVALVAMAVAARAARRNWQLLLAVPLTALAIVVATYPFAPDLARGKLELTALDVGQGDSLFVAFPDGRAMLIDGGGSYAVGQSGGMRAGFDTGEQVVSPYLWSRGLKRLDVAALTHAHQDHIEGLKAVLDNFRVRELWVARDVSSAAYRALLEHARVRGVRVQHPIRGQEFAWGGVSGRVLWPDASPEAESAKNNDSLVLRLEHGRVALLLTGDIERPVENELLAQGVPLRADFLKVGHHGSKTSTSAPLLAAVAPRAAVISAGETNPFGHPHPDVLERLRSSRVRVFRTDRDGAVTATSDGQTLRVHSFLEAR